MHLLCFLELKQPTIFFRASVLMVKNNIYLIHLFCIKIYYICFFFYKIGARNLLEFLFLFVPCFAKVLSRISRLFRRRSCQNIYWCNWSVWQRSIGWLDQQTVYIFIFYFYSSLLKFKFFFFLEQLLWQFVIGICRQQRRCEICCWLWEPTKEIIEMWIMISPSCLPTPKILMLAMNYNHLYIHTHK